MRKATLARAGKRTLGLLLSLVMLFSLMTVGVSAADKGTVFEDAILWVNGMTEEQLGSYSNFDSIRYLDEDEIGYNVVYGGAVDDDNIIDNTGYGIDSLVALKTAAKLFAVTAKVEVIDDETIGKVTITSVKERPTIGISWKSDSAASGSSTEYNRFKEAFNRNGANAVFLPQVGKNLDISGIDTTITEENVEEMHDLIWAAIDEAEPEAEELLASVDGIFFTGGEDWYSALYSEVPYAHGSSGFNVARDISDIALMRKATDMRIPLMGVCRGEQGYNIALGGGLIQDIPTYLGEKFVAGEIEGSRVSGVLSGNLSNSGTYYTSNSNDPQYYYELPNYATLNEDLKKDFGDTVTNWSVDPETGKYVSTTVDCPDEGAPHLRIQVDGIIHSGGDGYHLLTPGNDGDGILNSSTSKWMYDIAGDDTIDLVPTAHHQSVNPAKLGTGLTVVASSTDGIIEGIEYQANDFALAIQFHPERDALADTKNVDEDQDMCNAFLRALVEHATTYHKDTVGTDIEELRSDALLYVTGMTAKQLGSFNDNDNALDSICYPGEGEIGYDVVYKAAVSGTIMDPSGHNIDTLEELQAAAKEYAVTVSMALNSDGHIVALSVESVDERPTIGISWKRDTASNGSNSEYNRFMEAFNRNGANAVFLPRVGKDLDISKIDTTITEENVDEMHDLIWAAIAAAEPEAKAVLDSVDGIFFTGGEDWYSALYSEVPYAHGSSGFNVARDISDIALMRQATAMNIPLLGVCRGEQGYNIALGGGLIQDIPTYLGQQYTAGNISDERVSNVLECDDDTYYKFKDIDEDIVKGASTTCIKGENTPHLRIWVDGIVHTNGDGYHLLTSGNDGTGILESSKWMYDIAGGDTIDLVPTAHHQSVNPDKLGDGLTIVASSTDSIVEGIEYQANDFALAIQFHPERDALADTKNVDEDQDMCNAFLRALVTHAAAYEPIPEEEPDTDTNPSGGSNSSSDDSGSSGGSSTPSINNNAATTTPSTTTTSGYTDVPTGYWAESAIIWAKEQGYMNGTTSTTFSPSTSVNRQQLWMVLGRMAGADPADMAAARAWAMEAGLTDGTAPTNTMSRQQMVTMLYRYAVANGMAAYTGTLSGFPDVNAVADYATTAMAWAVGNGIINGTSDGRLNPTGTATRAQFAVILQRFINVMG